MKEFANKETAELSHNTVVKRFNDIRKRSEWQCEPLEIEDYGLQAMAETSPAKWHLAHTSWFFETFLLKPLLKNYTPLNPNIRYGKYEGEKERDVYLTWIDLKPYKSPEEIEQLEKLQEDEDIRFNYSQRHLESVFYLLYRDVGLDLNPDYQRGNVWSDEQKVSLIESIFKNIDIGKFTIIKREYKEDFDFLYEVLDGKQRIIAVTEFFEGRFTYKGKRYQDMHPHDQYHFKSYAISYAEISPLKDEQKYRYFLKLNTTGVPHDEEHLDKVREMWEEANISISQ